jgi:hypothetical protein
LKEVNQVLAKSINQQVEPGNADVVEAPAKKRLDITTLRRVYAT